MNMEGALLGQITGQQYKVETQARRHSMALLVAWGRAWGRAWGHSDKALAVVWGDAEVLLCSG